MEVPGWESQLASQLQNVTSTSLTLEAWYSFRVKMEENYFDGDILGDSDGNLEHVLELIGTAV